MKNRIIKFRAMKINDKVKVINGNNEIGQPTMIGKVGRISGFGTNYKVGGVDTKEVFVDFKHFGQHIFRDKAELHLPVDVYEYLINK